MLKYQSQTPINNGSVKLDFTKSSQVMVVTFTIEDPAIEALFQINSWGITPIVIREEGLIKKSNRFELRLTSKAGYKQLVNVLQWLMEYHIDFDYDEKLKPYMLLAGAPKTAKQEDLEKQEKFYYYPDNVFDRSVVANIAYTQESIYCAYIKDEVFIEVVKSCYLKWDKEEKVWVRHLTKYNGTLEDRLVELISLLIKSGIAVCVDNQALIDDALAEKYQLEQERWVLYAPLEHELESNPQGDLQLLWSDHDSNLFYLAMTLPQAQYRKPYINVPLHHHDAVCEFAEVRGFTLATEALRAIEQHKARALAEETQARAGIVLKKPTAAKRKKRIVEDGLEAILRVQDIGILDELKDN